MLKVRWQNGAERGSRETATQVVDADRVSEMGGLVVFTKTTNPPSTSEAIRLVVPKDRLLEAIEVSDDRR